MERYIRTQNSLYNGVTLDLNWQHLLLSWIKFVAPVTLSSVDAILHLKCVQSAIKPIRNIPEPVFLLLAAIAGAGRPELSEMSWSMMSEAWPTMWLWIQHIKQEFLAQIVLACGSVEKLVIIGCQRLERNAP